MTEFHKLVQKISILDFRWSGHRKRSKLKVLYFPIDISLILQSNKMFEHWQRRDYVSARVGYNVLQKYFHTGRHARMQDGQPGMHKFLKALMQPPVNCGLCLQLFAIKVKWVLLISALWIVSILFRIMNRARKLDFERGGDNFGTRFDNNAASTKGRRTIRSRSKRW